MEHSLGPWINIWDVTDYKIVRQNRRVVYELLWVQGTNIVMMELLDLYQMGQKWINEHREYVKNNGNGTSVLTVTW
jgi:hypothetical protein